MDALDLPNGGFRWRGGGRRCRGAYVVEFVLILFSLIALLSLIGEFLRLSLIDQHLARATHEAARAVAALPSTTGCENAVSTAFNDDRAARWLMDRNDDGTVDFNFQTLSANSWPDRTSTEDVQVVISWDDDPGDGTVAWSDGVAGLCGGAGSWLRLRVQLPVLPWSGFIRPMAPNGILLRHESWARNNRM